MYNNFRVAIMVVVDDTRRLADKETFERQFERVSGQLDFDKVYIEVYRSKVFATEEQIEAVKGYFRGKGIEVAGAVTPALDEAHGQFRSFDYENPAHRAECRQAIERAARHFDEVILDDFFFFNSKSDAAVNAKGDRGWTQYRLDTMREVSEEVVLEPARKVNEDVKVIIKYPNWYEHFQGLGYDLEHQPQMFDYIYTGTETRDPYLTDQLLQQYQSYLTFRYFSNLRPDGGNLGGWVDTFSTNYIDRYAEQLWDTLFAGAPEITLFNWYPMASERVVKPGERDAWAALPTSFNWEQMEAAYEAGGAAGEGPGWAGAAGYSLKQVDGFLGKLGEPVGIAAYKPYHSTGEDYLHNYLGNIGFPIELTSTFPGDADTLLLTESARHDPEIIDKIKSRLQDGADVIVTSGLLRAMQNQGFQGIVEIEYTGRTAEVGEFINGYGPGAGESLNLPGEDKESVLLPELRFLTNDSWPIIRGVAGAKGFPVVLMNRYSKGVLYVLTIPENMADLYNYPRLLLTQIKRYLLGDFPVRLEADALVSLFVYDNNTFIVQSFRDEPVTAAVSVVGENLHLRNIVTGDTMEPVQTPADEKRRDEEAMLGAKRENFELALQPHSYQVFEILD